MSSTLLKSLGARSVATGKDILFFVSSYMHNDAKLGGRFGAVMEDFELRDALESVYSNRMEQMAY